MNMSEVKLDITKTVRKSNILNEMRNANTTMTEYRLFCICMAHFYMNSKSPQITFRLNDYANIVGLKNFRRKDLEEQARNILSASLLLNTGENNRLKAYSVFITWDLFLKDNEWYVTLETHPKLFPLMKEQGKNFVRYKLYNTLFLKSFHHQRIYELLKQYEKIGERIIHLDDLRGYLSIGEGEYPVWYDLSSKILKTAQTAIAENTDIRFDYEGIRQGRKIASVKFIIYKNEGYKDKLQLAGWIPQTIGPNVYKDDGFAVKNDDTYIKYFAFSDCLTTLQMEECISLAKESRWYKESSDVSDEELRTYIVAQERYSASHEPKQYYTYLRKAIMNNYADLPACVKSEQNSSFDTAEFFELALKRSYGKSDNTESNE